VIDYFERRKQLKQAEEQAVGEGRLPPGQALTQKWPVLHVGAVPRFDPTRWRFRIWGLIAEPREWNWRDFSTLPRVWSTSDVHCVTRWTKLDNLWEGIPARDVLAQVQIDPEARFVAVHAPGYSANLPLEALLDEDVLFAFKHNGEDLTPEHGYPVRLVVPKLYFWKSVKWVNGLELMAEDRPGYWERLGYHNRGEPFAEERYSE
jgi:DMSO/TMAO reductase YedYZ molybdopterin-dependent catalytic subunit